MEGTMTSSLPASTNSSDNTEEILPIEDTITPLSLPSTEIERSQSAPVKSSNHRKRFPVRFNYSKKEETISEKDPNQTEENKVDFKRSLIPFFFSKIKSKNNLPVEESATDDKLKKIIKDLNEHPIEEFPEKDESLMNGCSKSIRRSRKFIRHMMEKPMFHYIIIVLIILDLIVVFVELTIGQLSISCLTEEQMIQYNTSQQPEGCVLLPTAQVEQGESALYYISLIIICIFLIEILSAFYAFGWRRYTKLLYLLDAIIIIASFILEVYFHFKTENKAGKASGALVVLRIWKIVRAIHAIAHSISLRDHMVIKEIENARELLHEEKIQAEKTIYEQHMKIVYLNGLLGSYRNTETDQQQIDQFIPRRTRSLDSITVF